MTDEQILATAHATGMMLISLGLDKQKVEFSILAFAKQIAKLEREACAEMFDGAVWAYDYREIAAAIRARGEA